MTFFAKRKRKNDDPPRFPAWVLVLIAIGLVIIVEIIFQPTNRSVSAPTVMSAGSTFTAYPFDITATFIIKRATAMAQGTPQSDVVDTPEPFQITASYIVKQLTNTALATSQLGTVPANSENLDSLEMTATAVVKQITQQASTPNS